MKKEKNYRKNFGLLLIILATIGATFIPIANSTPDRIFEDGFENDLTPWTGQSVSSGNILDTVTSTITAPHHGSYSLRSQIKDNTNAYVYKTFSGVPTVHLRMWVKFSTLPDWSVELAMIATGGWGTSNHYVSVGYQKGSSYGFKFTTHGSSGWTTLWTKESLNTNQWYCLELVANRGSGVTQQLYVDGVLKIETTVDTSAKALPDRFRVGQASTAWNGVLTAYYDCVVLDTAYIGTSCGAQPQGTLSVDSSPVKGQCFVNGTSWGTAPQTRTINIGTYTVSWGAVQGYVTPQPQTVTVSIDSTTSVVGVYEPVPPSPPSWSSLGHNATDAGAACRFSALWSDSDGLSGYIFSWNGTGTWTNSTWTPLSGTSAWSNVTMVLPSTKGIVVGYRFYANETYRGWGATSIGSLVVTKPQSWEETRLTMSIDPAPSMLTPPMWFDVSGSLTFVGNGTGIGGARLQVYIGYGDEFSLITTMVTEASGHWSFYWNPMATGEYVMRVVYQSDRSWTLGTKIEQTISM